MADKIFALLSVDVEEEGLFSGRYETVNPTINNSACLIRLEPFIERGFKPTLFCAYSAFADAPTLKMLENMRDCHGAEIGAHLHHWNTPPWGAKRDNRQPAILNRVPAGRLSGELLDAKLRNLFLAANNFQGEPVTTFRMGRWDLHAAHWALLSRNGVKTDASVRPLHCGADNGDGPDHFNAPINPYWIDCPERPILEVPLTATPLIPPLKKFLEQPGRPFRSSLHKWGVLALWPVQQPLWLMKLVTSLYISRGGKVVQLTWHSSEMMPGGSPHLPSEDSVKHFLRKVEVYTDWLEKKYSPAYASIGGLAKELGGAAARPKTGEDWLPAPEKDPLQPGADNV